MTQAEIDALLTAAKDEKYREFHSKIINTNLTMWGVRIPYIHKLAKQIARTEPKFFKTYKPENYEQILLYSLVIAYSKLSADKKFDLLDKILPLYDNWAHVDIVVGAFKDLGKNKEKFLKRYARLFNADEFERRFMIIFLMNYCLNENEIEYVFEKYEHMQNDDYYVNMGIAWGLSVALVKFYDRTVDFLRRGTMNEFIMKKTVQKARESYRISPERKAQLKIMFS